MERVIAFSMVRVIAFSIERILVRNALQLHRNFGVPLAFPQRSISRSICVPVTRSLLGYFCPVLYIFNKNMGSLCLGLYDKIEEGKYGIYKIQVNIKQKNVDEFQLEALI